MCVVILSLTAMSANLKLRSCALVGDAMGSFSLMVGGDNIIHKKTPELANYLRLLFSYVKDHCYNIDI